MPESINSKLKEQYDHDDSGGSLDTNLGDFLDSEGASGTSNNSKWRDWASGTGTSLNTRLFHKHGGSGSFMTRWKNWIAFSSTHSFNFDGSNDYLEFEDEFVFSGAFTVSFWVKHNSSGAEYVLGKASGDQDYFYVHPTSPRWRIANNLILSDTDMAVGVWHHVLAVRDSSDNFIWYLNGSLATVYNGSSYVTTGVTRSGDFDVKYLGRSLNIYGEIQLDEVAFWDTALSASDVTSIYNNGKVIDLSKSASYGTDRTGNLKLWLRCGDKAEPESTTAIARQDFYTDFDGADDEIKISDSSDLQLSTLTISAWIKPNGASEDGYIFTKFDDSTSGGYALGILGSTDKIRLLSSGVSIAQSDAVFVDDNVWVHIAVTVDASGNLVYYRNGVSAGTASSVTLNTNSVGAVIGNRTGGSLSGHYFNGSISNISVYKTALDAQTISQMAKSRFSPVRNSRFSVVDFDGSNDYIDCGDINEIDGASVLSISAWIKCDVTSGNHIILSKYSSLTSRIEFLVSSNSLFVAVPDGSTMQGLVSFTDTGWNHVAMVFDGSGTGNSGRLKIYLNGENQTLSYNGTIPSALPDIGSNVVTIGGRAGSSSLGFNGGMGQVSIYNTAKSAEEIYAIYQQGITYDESSLSGLVGYWRMGDDTSKAYPTIADSSSNSNDGTITNGASDDIVQQMVGGWDLGSFESSSEELGANLIEDSGFDDASYWNAGGDWSVSGSKATSGTGTYDILQPSSGNFNLVNGRLYKFTASITLVSGSGNFKFFANDTNIALTLTSGTNTYTAYLTSDGTVPRIRMQGGSAIIEVDDFLVKEVLQSEVSDTYPAIIDVNEPVLGAELVTSNTTSNWTAMGSGTSKANITNGVTLTAGTDARNHFYTVSGTSSNKIYKFNVDAFIDDGSDTNAKINVYDGSASNLLDALTTTTQNFTFYFIHNGTPFIQFDGFDNGTTVNIQNMSIKEIQGNVGTMTNQDSADLVYSSVLPDQSFLTGVNSAYNFISLDGANDYVNTGSPFQSTFRDSFSVSAWIKPTDGIPSAESAIFAVRGSGGRFYIRVLSDGRFSSYIHDGTSSKATLPNSVTFSDGQEDWHHVCAVINNSTNLVLLYVDGVEQALQSGTYSGDISSLTLSNFTSTDNIYIGARNNQGSADRFFNGDIGQIALWSKALSSTEVSAIYTAGRYSNLLNSYSDNLKAYYAFGALDAVTGLSDTTTTIYDRSGNSNHGTPVSIASADLKSPPNAEPNGYAKGDTNRSTTTP